MSAKIERDKEKTRKTCRYAGQTSGKFQPIQRVWKKLLRQQACERNMPWSFWLLHMLELGS